jgi:hypothetical protein
MPEANSFAGFRWRVTMKTARSCLDNQVPNDAGSLISEIARRSKKRRAFVNVANYIALTQSQTLDMPSPPVRSESPPVFGDAAHTLQSS